MPERPPPKLALTTQEAAAALSVGERTLRKWMRVEGLPYLRVGGAVRIPLEDLRAWMQERTASERAADALAAEILESL